MNVFVLAAISTVFVVVGKFHLVSCGCPCEIVLHKQNEFCHNDYDFIIRAKVGNEKNLGESGKIKYKLKSKKMVVYKSTSAYDNLTDLKKKWLFTETDGDKCKAILEKNKIYVLAGRVEKQKMWTFSCDWIQAYDQLTSVEKFNLKKGYKKNCGCTVVPGTPVVVLDPEVPSCPLFVSQMECARNATCACNNKKNCTRCQFEDATEFNDCISGIPVPIGKK